MAFFNHQRDMHSQWGDYPAIVPSVLSLSAFSLGPSSESNSPGCDSCETANSECIRRCRMACPPLTGLCTNVPGATLRNSCIADPEGTQRFPPPSLFDLPSV